MSDLHKHVGVGGERVEHVSLHAGAEGGVARDGDKQVDHGAAAHGVDRHLGKFMLQQTTDRGATNDWRTELLAGLGELGDLGGGKRK